MMENLERCGCVIDTVCTGPTVRYMALSPDGRTLYAVQRVVEPDDVFGTVVVIDTQTRTITDTIQLGAGIPFQIVLTPDGTKAFVAISKKGGGPELPDSGSSGENSVVLIDTTTNAINRIKDPESTERSAFGLVGLAVTPDGSKVYATHRGESTSMSIRKLSSPGESHPRALPEPYVSLSAHTAPIVQPLTSPLLGMATGFAVVIGSSHCWLTDHHDRTT